VKRAAKAAFFVGTSKGSVDAGIRINDTVDREARQTMKLKALALALFVAGLVASFALAGPPPGKGNGKADKGQAVAAAGASTGTAVDKKYWVCHKAGNSGKYVKLHVAKKSDKAHLKHGDVLPAADGSCPAAAPKTGGDDADDETTTTGTTTTTATTTAATTTTTTP
jgi:hypothetical protein